MISKYLDDKNQVLKQPSSAAVQERKRMKIELTNEGIRTANNTLDWLAFKWKREMPIGTFGNFPSEWEECCIQKHKRSYC